MRAYLCSFRDPNEHARACNSPPLDPYFRTLPLSRDNGVDGVVGSNRDLQRGHGQAEHGGDLRMTDVAADGADVNMTIADDDETPRSAARRAADAGRERRHSMGHADEETADVEGFVRQG